MDEIANKMNQPQSGRDTRRIRRLKTPTIIEVAAAAEGTPLRLCQGNAWHDVKLARRPWRIDQHWWRSDPVRRVYYRLEVEDGAPLTVYYDEIAQTWFRQEY